MFKVNAGLTEEVLPLFGDNLSKMSNLSNLSDRGGDMGYVDDKVPLWLINMFDF
jgi:hypothetical protein